MSIIDKRFGKLASKFLSVHLVLVMDLVLSLLASALVAGVAYLLIKPDVPSNYPFLITWLISSVAASVLMFLATKTYVIIIRHTTFRDLLRFVAALLGKVVLMGVAILAFTSRHFITNAIWLMLLADFLISLLFLLGIRLIMIAAYEIYKSRIREIQKCARVIVYGTSEQLLTLIFLH